MTSSPSPDGRIRHLPRRPQSLSDRLAFDRWVRAQMPIVKSIARQLKRRLPSSIEEGDLVQWGLLGLMQARKRFKGQEPQFSSFARRRIHGAMLDGLREIDPAPREHRRLINRASRNAGQLEQILGRQPTGAEIAKRSGMCLSQYYRLLSEHSAFQPMDLQSHEELAECSDDFSKADPLKLLIDQCARKRLRDAVALLPQRERTLLHWRLSKHLTLRRIAAKLGVTESRVSQLLGSTSQSLRLELSKGEADGGA